MVNEAFNTTRARFHAYARRARQMLRRFDVESDLDASGRPLDPGMPADARVETDAAHAADSSGRSLATVLIHDATGGPPQQATNGSDYLTNRAASANCEPLLAAAEFGRADRAPWRIYRALHKIEKELEASSSGTIILANGDDIDFIDRRGPVKETAREVLNHVAELYHLDEMGAAQHILDGDIQDASGR